MSATIKDVAKLAGVSPSTVTRTCQNLPSISEETKRKVRSAMSALGYTSNYPDPQQTAPAVKSTAIIFPPFRRSDLSENTFYLKSSCGIASLCREYHWTVSMVMGETEEELLENAKLLIESGRADSFLFLYSKNQDILIDYFHSSGIPYVLIGKVSAYPSETIYVDSDNLLAAREAVDYLISLGHSRIAYLSGDTSFLFNQDRYAGYVQSLMQHQLPFLPEHTFHMEDLSQEAGLARMKSVFTGQSAPTALLVSDDMLIRELECRLIEWNIRIPEQLSLITFNDSSIALHHVPQLTAININPWQLGAEAVRQLKLHLDSPMDMASKVLVPHRLVIRDSCAPLCEAPFLNQKT